MLANLHEGEDRLRVDRHLSVLSREAVALEQLIVVLDETVVDAHDGAVTLWRAANME